MLSLMEDKGASAKAKQQVRRIRGPLNGLVADRMRQLGIPNVTGFAQHAGLSDTAMYDVLGGRIINGVVIMPKWDTITKLAAALGKPTHEILYILDPEAPGADSVFSVQQVPVYLAGCVGAGPQQQLEIAGEITVDKEFAEGRDLVAYRVCGNSMAGGRHPIYNDDVVIVDRRLEGEINQPVVARLRDNGYICKRLRPGGVLDSANPDHTDPNTSLVTPDRVAQVVGRVVRIISNALA